MKHHALTPTQGLTFVFLPKKKHKVFFHLFPLLTSAFKTNSAKKKTTGSENENDHRPQKSTDARLPRHPEFMSAIMFIAYRSPSFQSSSCWFRVRFQPPTDQLGVDMTPLVRYRTMGVSIKIQRIWTKTKSKEKAETW